MKPFGIHGSTTNHGGIVISTQQRSSTDGSLFLRAGDGFFCPKCKCWSTLIKSNDFIIFDGKAVAFAGDRFTCSARLIEKQLLVIGENVTPSQVKSHDTHSSFLSNTNKLIFDDKYQIMSESDEPIKNTKYIVTRADGSEESGVTDSNGYTHLISTSNSSEIISLKITHDY